MFLIREVAERLGLGKSTVGRILAENKSDVERSKGGRPGLLSVTDKNYCVQKVTLYCEDSAVNVAKDLEKDVRVKYNPETVLRVLRSRGLGSIENPKRHCSEARTLRSGWNGVMLIKIGQ